MLDFDGQNSCDHFEPVLVEAAHAVRQHAALLPASDFECRVESGDTALSNIDRKWKKRIPANQDVTDCLLKLFELSIVAVLVNENKFFFPDFSKKAENLFLKKWKVKKMRNSAEKRKIDITTLWRRHEACVIPTTGVFFNPENDTPL